MKTSINVPSWESSKMKTMTPDEERYLLDMYIELGNAKIYNFRCVDTNTFIKCIRDDAGDNYNKYESFIVSTHDTCKILVSENILFNYCIICDHSIPNYTVYNC